MDKKGRIHCVSCGIFRNELRELIKREELPLETTFTNSMLHMYPSRLEKDLNARKDKLGKEDKLLLLFGDCQPHMEELTSHEGVSRTGGVNCCQIILGKDLYNSYRKERVFFLLPEWAVRWREVFQEHLGFNKDTARSFMKEMHSRLVFIDTQLQPIDHKMLEEIKDYCGIPLEILPCGLEELKKALNRSIGELKNF